MLTADLVRTRRRGGTLHLVQLDAESRERAVRLAEILLAVTASHVGRTRADLGCALEEVDVGPREQRLKDGLCKLIEDHCDFDAGNAHDPPSIRRAVFLRASAARAALGPGEIFDRERIVADAALALGATVEAVERGLFADLRSSHVLRSTTAPSAAALVALYDRAQAQAVLLRAVQVRVELCDFAPEGLRALFRKLKFLRLLYTIERTGQGHRLVLDGPFSLFDSVTKYGLQLSLVIPALDECGAWRLEADVLWGKQRLPLLFRLAGGASTGRATAARPPDDVRALVQGFRSLDTPWRVSECKDVLELPGVGLCIPDLVFERPAGARLERVHFEVMGYWSRAAVWKRVELVRAGLAARILFAVSAHLRVSEEVLDEDLPGAIYVYKRTMSARAVTEHLDRLVARKPGSG
ncbi:MAG TPA: DUF790 family protein [Polyangiaceae bacterium]|nr:DUF790 family protein [Polyangiaceae bacterium]